MIVKKFFSTQVILVMLYKIVSLRVNSSLTMLKLMSEVSALSIQVFSKRFVTMSSVPVISQ